MLSVIKKKPNRLVLKPNQTVISSPGEKETEIWVYEDAVVEPLSKCVMLEPIYSPQNYMWGLGAYTFSDPEEFTILENVYGRQGIHVMRRDFADASPWYASLSPSLSIEAYRGVYLGLFWARPNASVIVPNLDILVRFSPNILHPSGACWTPIAFRMVSEGYLDVYEAHWRTITEWQEDPEGTSLRRAYRHPMESRERNIGPYNKWLTMWIQPLDEKQFLVRADWLLNGGFVYKSSIEREYDLFPDGGVAIRSYVGGGAAWQFCPCEYATSGYILSEVKSRSVEDTVLPTTTISGYVPASTVATVDLYTPEGETLTSGVPFTQWRYKLSLSGNGQDTPRVFGVTFDWEAEISEAEQEPEDVSDDVIEIQISMSKDNITREGSLVIRNPAQSENCGKYDRWLQEPYVMFDIDINNEDFAVVYGENPSFNAFSTQKDLLAPTIEYRIRDGWSILDYAIVKDSPDYGGMKLSDAIKRALTDIGFFESDLDIDECTFELPKEDNGQRTVSRAADGIKLSELLVRWHDDFASNWKMGFTRDGKFQFKSPSEPVVSRTFYLSRAQAEMSYNRDIEKYNEEGGEEPNPEDYQYFVGRNMNITLNTKDFRNELWVIGLDKTTGKPIISSYIDSRSMNDPTYENYVGQRRLLIYVNGSLNTEELTNWVLAEWKKFYCVVRRNISFTARFDPLLSPGDYIKIDGISGLWRLESIGVAITRDNIVPRLGQIINTQYTAVEWPEQTEEPEE